MGLAPGDQQAPPVLGVKGGPAGDERARAGCRGLPRRRSDRPGPTTTSPRRDAPVARSRWPSRWRRWRRSKLPIGNIRGAPAVKLPPESPRSRLTCANGRVLPLNVCGRAHCGREPSSHASWPRRAGRGDGGGPPDCDDEPPRDGERQLDGDAQRPGAWVDLPWSRSPGEDWGNPGASRPDPGWGPPTRDWADRVTSRALRVTAERALESSRLSCPWEPRTGLRRCP
jgi:hypothetical protein